MPVAVSRAHLAIFNNSTGLLCVAFGGGRATATVTSNAVASVAVNNAGQGYSVAPDVVFIGGGNTGWNQANSSAINPGQIGYPAPAHPAKAHCVMTGSAPNMSISSIVVDDGGSGYDAAPYVWIRNNRLDPNGCFAATATTNGSIPLAANTGSLIYNGTCCPIDQVAIYGATSGQAFACYYMP